MSTFFFFMEPSTSSTADVSSGPFSGPGTGSFEAEITFTNGGVTFTLSATQILVPSTGIFVSASVVASAFNTSTKSLTGTLKFDYFGFGSGSVVTSTQRLTLSFATTANRTGWQLDNILGSLDGVQLASIPTQVIGNQIIFTSSTVNPGDSNSSSFSMQGVRVTFTCFCVGTGIATPDGRRVVEDLQPGELVRLADGRDVAVRWVDRQRVDTRLAHPRDANPIRIMRGALGAGLPERDLRVSPDHAIAIDGYLINAGALVNGRTIYQEHDVREDFTYYHIETDAHELILAEGVAAETFVDYTTRDAFENAEEATTRMIPEMPLPRISSVRLVPQEIKHRLQPVMAAE